MLFLILISSNNSNIKFINNIKNLNTNKYIYNILLVVIISMSGIPPFFGFSGKFVLFITILYNLNYYIIIIVIVLNFNAIFFYIQNIRFMIKKNKRTDNSYLIFKNYVNSNILKIILFLFLFNILNIFFLSDVVLLSSILSTYIFI